MTAIAPGRTGAASLLRATGRLHLLEYHGVPYDVDVGSRPRGALAHLPSVAPSSRPDGPRLFWVDRDVPGGPALGTSRGGHSLDGFPIHGPILLADLAAAWLGRVGGWRPWRELGRSPGAAAPAAIWRHEDGSVLLPFDPDGAVHAVLSEAYHGAAERADVRAGTDALRRGYYRLRPLLSRGLQIALRRSFARLQRRHRFPRWPIEPALHDFYDTILRLLAAVAGEPVPTIAPWPQPWTWCLVLTHDVEEELGYRNITPITRLERARGYRSCWNFVPRRYRVDDTVLADLVDVGFEVGVHGLYHDGREMESLATWTQRLPAIHDQARVWKANGYRSPATHRHWDLMALLDFDYDSSYPDTDPYEPMSGGCCSWLPYLNRDLVELPITLPQDFTLFTLLGHRDETLWVNKARYLRGRGGMALLDTHPDYLVAPGARTAYRRFLDHFSEDTTAWKALPGEVASWWRRRQMSRVVRRSGGWFVEGTAADEAQVRLVG